MDLQSFIQLREAYKQVHAPTEAEYATEEEILSEEDLQENPNAGAGHKNTDTKKDWANDPRWGVIGQLERARRKGFGTEREKRQANSYETSVNNISKRQGTTPGQAKITANDVAAETRGRRKADPNYKPGENQASNKNTAQVGPNSNQKNDPPKNDPPKNDPPKNDPPKNDPPQTAPKTQPAAKLPPAKQKQTGDKKKDMAAWAKANPKLAAAKAERDRTRGTSSSTNPLMKSFKGNLPKAAPKAAPAKAADKPDTAKSGNLFNKAADKVKSVAPKAAAPKSRPLTTKAAPATGDDAMKKLKSFTSGKKLGEDVTEFDLIIGHLVEQGFPVDEALKLMVNMSEEKREQILETTRRTQDNASGARGPEFSAPAKAALRTAQNASGQRGPEFVNPAKAKMKKQGVNDSAMSPTRTGGKGPGTPMKEETVEEGMHREADTGKVVDKAEPGKTYYPNMPKKKSSVALRKEKEAAEKKKQKTHKEEMDSLMSAYQSMFVSEEETEDSLRDKRQERGGVDGNVRYDRAPKASGGEKKKKKDTGMSAFDSVVAELKGKYGDKAIKASRSEKKKEDW